MRRCDKNLFREYTQNYRDSIQALYDGLETFMNELDQETEERLLDVTGNRFDAGGHLHGDLLILYLMDVSVFISPVVGYAPQPWSE